MNEIRFKYCCENKNNITINVEITLPILSGDDFESLERDMDDIIQGMDLKIIHKMIHGYSSGNLVTILK